MIKIQGEIRAIRYCLNRFSRSLSSRAASSVSRRAREQSFTDMSLSAEEQAGLEQAKKLAASRAVDNHVKASTSFRIPAFLVRLICSPTNLPPKRIIMTLISQRK